ncbi:hypothetical protein [Massilia sp. Leaf139]|uniref:hypothetical protein n=1 Tax=Massilia sp. Leaf139 TaxID=1736272 RepID=UPI0006FC1332|nr:hypothetical protein [Massilia sp. Leaf139]KQQ88934.1 hypothetical protein ASF77_09470 [Massilia sp. Leaf139]
MNDSFAGGVRERRSDPVLGALVDVAIAYRDNLGVGVAAAFMRETRVPDAVAQRVLDRTAYQRTQVPRRRLPRPEGSPSGGFS